MYIEYWIVDSRGNTGNPHSKNNTDSDSRGSTLFNTFAARSTLRVLSMADEVIILVTASDGRCLGAWKSDSKIDYDSDMDDTDVRWKTLTCY
jgi:hypothetical protein